MLRIRRSEVEPTWMTIGQGAGVAAALAAKAGRDVRALPRPALRAAPPRQNQALDLPELPPVEAKDG